MNNVKLLHKVQFFAIFNSPVASKNFKKFCPPRKSWNDAPAILLHNQMTTRAGSLVYVRVESGLNPACDNISGLYQSFPAVLKGLGS